MEREEILSYIESFGGAAYDCPFEGDFDSVVLRHVSTRRWFGLYFAVPKRYFGEEGEGSEFCLNLKCPPPLAAALRETYAAVLPAILVKSGVLAIAASLAARYIHSVNLLALLAVVLAYQVIGTAFEWAFTGSFYLAVQDFRIGLPGMLLQWVGGYALLKAIAKR